MSRKVHKGKGKAAKSPNRGVRDPKALAASTGQKAQPKGQSPRLAAKGRKRLSHSGGGTWGEVT